MRTALLLLALSIAACAADAGIEDVATGAAGGPSIAPSDVGVSAQAQTISFINSNNGVPLSSESSTKKAGIRCLAMVSGGTNVNNAFSCGAEECVRGNSGASVYHFKATSCVTLSSPMGSWQRRCAIVKTSVSPPLLIGFMFYTQGADKVGYYQNLGGPLVGNCEIGAHKANWPPTMSAPSMPTPPPPCPPGIQCGPNIPGLP